jgi:superfamily II DNA/RNA helicase
LPSAFAQSRPNSGFGDFQLSTAVVNALEDSRYRTPRPIQRETIPAYLSGRDVMGLAQTGTGKTSAFDAPILHRLASEESRRTRLLILAPTRELATQIEREISVLARYTHISTLKDALLDSVLSENDCTTGTVCMRKKRGATRTAKQLEERGRRAVALEGNISLSQLDRAVARFREKRLDILAATDIATLGLRVAGIDYVVNFNVPSTPDSYTRRIGRTGGSQAHGRARTFVKPNDRSWLRGTERQRGQRIRVCC